MKAGSHGEPQPPHPDAGGNVPGAILGRTAALIRYTTGVVCLAAYALSLAAFVLWVFVTVRAVLQADPRDGKAIIHLLLTSIELLLIVPIPAVIGVVVYQTLGHMADPTRPELERTHQQVNLAKSILVGFLVTVTGTTLLDILITTPSGIDLNIFLAGGLLIVALSAYIWVAGRR
jgi:hypothetical protein